MAVRITDIYNPLTFSRRTQEAQTEVNAFLASGIAVSDPVLQDQLNAGGNIGDINVYGPIATTEPRYSNDNPADVNSTHGKIANKLQKYRSAQRNYSWQLMDLARELADADPVGAITGRIGAFWAADDQSRLIQSLLGVLADNVANDSGDMVVDVATDAAGAVTDAERISGNVVIDGMQTLGDHKMAVTAMAIHSAIHARLQKQQLIDYVRDADNNIMFERYLGKRLIIDDALPAVAGTNRITYTCALFGNGAVLTGNGQVETPSEIDRNPDAANGGGEQRIYSRVNNVFHPNGFSFISGSVAGQSATYAELAAAANWNRIVERKNIPIAFLQVND
jgi:hypothetical protein